MEVLLDLNVYTANMLNVAQTYVQNFSNQYEADDTAPVVQFHRSRIITTDEYNRSSYDFAMAYVNRHRVNNQNRNQNRNQNDNQNPNQNPNQNRNTGGSRRGSRKQKRGSRK